jgi:acyl-CoA thioester hydrolase
VNEQVYRHRHRVTYSECTIGNHVYYGRYLDYLEEGRGEFFRHLGRSLLQWQEADLVFPVIEARIRYKAAARYDDWVVMDIWLSQLEGVRLAFAYRLATEDGRLLAEASTSHVFASLREKPRRPPEDLCALLRPYLRIEEGPVGQSERSAE